MTRPLQDQETSRPSTPKASLAAINTCNGSSIFPNDQVPCMSQTDSSPRISCDIIADSQDSLMGRTGSPSRISRFFIAENGQGSFLSQTGSPPCTVAADGCRGYVSRTGSPTPNGRSLVTITEKCQSSSRYISRKVSPSVGNDLVLVAGNIKPSLHDLTTSQKPAPVLPKILVDDSASVVDNRAGSASISIQSFKVAKFYWMFNTFNASFI